MHALGYVESRKLMVASRAYHADSLMIFIHPFLAVLLRPSLLRHPSPPDVITFPLEHRASPFSYKQPDPSTTSYMLIARRPNCQLRSMQEASRTTRGGTCRNGGWG